MCNLRDNTRLLSSTATVRLLLKNFYILCYENTDSRLHLTSGQHKSSAEEEDVFKLLLALCFSEAGRN